MSRGNNREFIIFKHRDKISLNEVLSLYRGIFTGCAVFFAFFTFPLHPFVKIPAKGSTEMLLYARAVHLLDTGDQGDGDVTVEGGVASHGRGATLKMGEITQCS